MRLRSVTFAPFGALRDLTLDLAGPPGVLHVVYGPNEAGKSTALRGLIAFFFGIPHQTADQHDKGRELRVRATIDDGAGRTFDVVRRKGRKDTLRDGITDLPVPDDDLRRWIGGVDEATFRQLHALDHVRLREGAEAILRGKGRLGELLLEAQTGATGLLDRLERLRAEAGFYRSRASTDPLTVAVKDWTSAVHASAHAALSHTSWQEQERGIEDLRARVVEADARLRDARAELAQLERTLEVQGSVRKLRRQRAARAELGVVTDVPEGSATQREELARDSTEAALEVERAETDLVAQRAAADRAGTRAAVVPPSFDAALGRELRARVERARAARGEAAADLEALDRALAAAVARLGPAPDGGAAWDELEIDGRMLARAQARAVERRDAGGQRLAAARALGDAEAKRARLLATSTPGGTAGGPPAAPAPQLEALEAALATARRAALAARARDDLEARAIEVAARLAAALPGGSTDEVAALARAAAPDVAALAAEERARAAAASSVSSLARDLEAALDRRGRAATALDALRGGASLPAAEDLDVGRKERDARLEAALGALDQGDAAGAARTLRGLVTAIHAADVIADRLRHDAARVEHAARLVSEERAESDRAATLGQALERARAMAAAGEASWAARWPLLAGQDLDGARAWCARRELVAALATEQAALRARCDVLGDEVAESIGMLAAVGCGNGEAPARQTTLEALIATAERRAGETQAALRAGEARAAAIARADDDHDAAQRELRRAETAEETASRALEALVAPFGLDGETPLEETTAVLAALSEATRDRRRRADLAAKMARLDAEIAAASAEWTEASTTAGLGGLGFEEALARAESARDARLELERLEEAMAARLAVLDRERERHRRAAAKLEELHARTGVPGDQLAAAEERARAARHLDREIAQYERMVIASLGASTMAEAEERLRDVDFDLVEKRAEGMAEDIVELEARRDRDLRAIGGSEKFLEDMGGESKAAEKAEEAEAHLARARVLARRAAVARAAVALLEREIERHRADREGPVLRRAGELFRALTEDRWGGLRVSEGEDGEPEIRCVREGHELPVGALSQGTADQLYLALRLAAIEHQARGGARLPLLLDDVLVHFDAERKAAALVALAGVATTVQVILFTHERDVADAARARLGARAVVHELAQRP